MTKSLLAAVALKTKNLFLAVSHFCDWCRKFSNKFFLSFFCTIQTSCPWHIISRFGNDGALNVEYRFSNVSYLWEKRYCTHKYSSLFSTLHTLLVCKSEWPKHKPFLLMHSRHARNLHNSKIIAWMLFAIILFIHFYSHE